MPTILISYRRSDSLAIAGRIFDRLSAHYGEDSVFMDIDDIPYGVDFRSHIHNTLQRTDVMLALIGVNWVGADAGGITRIHEPTDPVRVEIETALARNMSIIPVLVGGAKMPSDSDLPASFGNFAFLNAAEVATGRDFRTHMDRLIAAVDRLLSGEAEDAWTSAPASGRQAAAEKPWLADLLRYVAVPLILILVAHHAIVSVFDLNVAYLWTACAAIPFVFGFFFFWAREGGAGIASIYALALGLLGAAGMTVSQSLSSGDPIMPQTRVEWWDNVNFAAIVALGFLAGHVLARALRALQRLKFGKA